MTARHDKYYFEDEDAIFQVGDKLFRIHKRRLVGSETSAFASMFSLPQSQDAEGQTDEKPIILRDKPEEFEALMRILYPPLLDNLMKIPIATYIQAMRIAVKYSMDDVQKAIVEVINSFSFTWEYSTAIARLAFVVEFPNHFPKSMIREVFVQSCPKTYHPSGNDLKPLMAYPNLVALMMQYREGIILPSQAVWSKKSPFSFGAAAGTIPAAGTTPAAATAPASGTPLAFSFGPAPVLQGTAEDKWLNEQFKALGLV